MDKEYEEYLASPDWRRERQARIETSGGLCEICRWPLGYKTPHIHHENYDNVGHELLTDTKVCHAKCHAYKHRKEEGEVKPKTEDEENEFDNRREGRAESTDIERRSI